MNNADSSVSCPAHPSFRVHSRMENEVGFPERSGGDWLFSPRVLLLIFCVCDLMLLAISHASVPIPFPACWLISPDGCSSAHQGFPTESVWIVLFKGDACGSSAGAHHPAPWCWSRRCPQSQIVTGFILPWARPIWD